MKQLINKIKVKNRWKTKKIDSNTFLYDYTHEYRFKYSIGCGTYDPAINLYKFGKRYNGEYQKIYIDNCLLKCHFRVDEHDKQKIIDDVQEIINTFGFKFSNWSISHGCKLN